MPEVELMLLGLKMIMSSCGMHCMVHCDCCVCCGMHCDYAKCADLFALWAFHVCARLIGSCPEMHLSVCAAGGLLSTLRSAPKQQSFTGKQQGCTPGSIWDVGVCPVQTAVIPSHLKVALGKLKPLLEEHISAANGQ